MAFGFDFVVVAVMTASVVVAVMEVEAVRAVAVCGGQLVAPGVRRVAALQWLRYQPGPVVLAQLLFLADCRLSSDLK